ncbi:MAG: FeoA family protein [Blastocatellia bacterium]
MRLTEEIIELLTALGSGESSSSFSTADLKFSRQIENPEELIQECLHEGYVTGADGAPDKIRLTDEGSRLLCRIRNSLTDASSLKTGEQARLAFLSTRNYSRFQKLSSLGLSPGVPVTIRQKFPSFVIQCEETQIALEEEIARDIFVWRD